MKTLKAIIFASAALLAAAACTKEANPKESVPSAPGTIEVSVTALIGDLTPSEGTKATMDPVIRLTWENNDKVYAYGATQKLGDLTVTPVEGGSSAKLSGDISTPAANTTKITLVYCNTADTAPAIDGSTGKITFDLNNQNAAANPFVVYATLDYTAGQTSITDKIVPFNFATSLMRVTVTGIANEDITAATVSGVNTKCELTVSATTGPDVSGTTPGTITRAAAGITKSTDGRAVFNVSVAAEAENTNRKLTIKQGDLIYGSDLMSGAIDAGTSIISVYALTEQTGSRGKINGHDYVYVAGKKWATQNIAITDSGKKEWKPGSEAVKVPGTDTDVVVGDYFQWGAYPGYCGNATDADKGLLIYKSFKITKYDGTKNSFTGWKQSGSTNYQFSTSSISPYFSSSFSSSYTRYNSSDKAYTPNLYISDDVAHTLWSESWRMPTSAEFVMLCAECFVERDATNKGLLFYAPKSAADKGLLKWSESNWKQITGTDTSYGTTTKTATVGTYTATDALLFFPAAGDGYNGDLCGVGTFGFYWSSTLYSDNTDFAYYLSFWSGNVYPQYSGDRYGGFSVRPLSD